MKKISEMSFDELMAACNAEHETTRDVAVKAGQETVRAVRHVVEEQHETTRDTVVTTGRATVEAARDLHEETRKVIRSVGSIPKVAIFVGVACAILAMVITGMLCWQSIEGYLCWTLDAAGNRVQVANLEEATRYAKLLNGVVAVAVGALVGWATSEIVALFRRD